MQKLSIIIPTFNEQNTIIELLNRIQEINLIQNIEKEIIIVDDASTDDTLQLIQSNYSSSNIKLDIQILKNKVNRGKGFCIREGLNKSSGDFIIVQDADLEYNPEEYNILLKPILDGYADIVYGSRFIGDKPHRILFFWHYFANKFLTIASNMFSNLNLTDMETCYKMFKREFIIGINLKENRFGFEPEITAKIARIKNIRIYEVGISYFGRTYSEGKKIRAKDAFRALYCILKYGLLKL
jgi:glycosyltransferase involved in cell wall biosynthesis